MEKLVIELSNDEKIKLLEVTKTLLFVKDEYSITDMEINECIRALL
jgi:hypothetical protein